jgi:hypothetical protein
MSKQEDFIRQVEAVLHRKIGVIIADSILKNNLSKLNKSGDSLTKDDCKLLSNNIAASVALFVTKDETRQIKTELEGLLKVLD